MTSNETLGDLGERRIIREMLVPRYGASSERFGDDCAVIPAAAHMEGALVVTTDPCPPPMAFRLGFKDEYFRGWLLATINLSDLAAAGAIPLGVVTSLQLPAETLVADFERLLDGLDACCAASGVPVVGGNLKEAPSVDVSATALGVVSGTPLTRSGARPGHDILVLGHLGSFWAGVLGVERGLIERDAREPLLVNALTPAPKLQVGAQLREASYLSACIDNSDGLWPSLEQLGKASGVAMVVRSGDLQFSDGVEDVATGLGTDPVRLALGWGDWQLIATAHPRHRDAIEDVAQAEGIELHIIGTVVEGTGVDLEHDGRQAPMLRLDSERFTPESWFGAGLDGYIDHLLTGPLQEAR